MLRLRVHKLLVFVALIFIGGPATTAKAQPLELQVVDALQQCMDSLDANDSEFSMGACPRLQHLLENERISQQVDIPLFSDATQVTLQELHDLFTEYTLSVPESRLDFAGLDQLLQETLVIPDEKSPNFWERFLEWLKQQQLENNADWKWLQELLSNLQPPQWLGTLIFRGAISLTLLLALAIVVNEIRLSEGFPFFRKRSKKLQTGRTQGAFIQAQEVPDFHQITTMPLHQQPAALLNWMIAELVSKNLLPDNRSLTNGEYCSVIRQRENRAALGFSDLIGLLDDTIYGNRKINSEIMDNLLGQTDKVVTTLTGRHP